MKLTCALYYLKRRKKNVYIKIKNYFYCNNHNNNHNNNNNNN